MIRMLRSLAGVTTAELQALARDRGAQLVLVVAVVFYAFFYPLPYMPEVLEDVPIIILDRDQTPLSRQLARMVDAGQLVRVVGRTAAPGEARTEVLEGRANGALEIPSGFERRIHRGDPVTVGVYADASYFLVYRQVATGLAAAARTLSAGIEIRRFQGAGMDTTTAGQSREPLRLITHSLYNPTEGYASYIVPSVLVLILQQTLLIGIGMVAGTRTEAGTAVGTAHPLATVIGRALVYLPLYAVHALFYFGVVFRLYGFPERGDKGDTVMFAVPFLLSVVFLGLAASAFFRRRETAIQVLVFTSLPAVFLAGFSWPAESIPAWLRALSQLLPSTAGIEGFLRLNQMGATLGQVQPEWWTLWGLTAGYLVLAWFAESRRSPVHHKLAQHREKYTRNSVSTRITQ